MRDSRVHGVVNKGSIRITRVKSIEHTVRESGERGMEMDKKRGYKGTRESEYSNRRTHHPPAGQVR